LILPAQRGTFEEAGPAALNSSRSAVYEDGVTVTDMVLRARAREAEVKEQRTWVVGAGSGLG